jgi:hypothetical protein
MILLLVRPSGTHRLSRATVRGPHLPRSPSRFSSSLTETHPCSMSRRVRSSFSLPPPGLARPLRSSCATDCTRSSKCVESLGAWLGILERLRIAHSRGRRATVCDSRRDQRSLVATWNTIKAAWASYPTSIAPDIADLRQYGPGGNCRNWPQRSRTGEIRTLATIEGATGQSQAVACSARRPRCGRRLTAPQNPANLWNWKTVMNRRDRTRGRDDFGKVSATIKRLHSSASSTPAGGAISASDGVRRSRQNSAKPNS